MQNQKKIRDLEIPLSERWKSIPGFFGIRLAEEPSYEMLVSDGAREIRRYPPLTLATASAPGTFEDASGDAFLRLADYLFRSPEKHPLPHVAEEEGAVPVAAMTAPVLQQKSRSGWTLSFILPANYTLESAPRPSDRGITIQQVPSRLMATLRYSGANDEAKIDEQARELLAWIQRNGTFRATGEVICAQYDGPHTLSFLRRNEIQIPVLVNH